MAPNNQTFSRPLLSAWTGQGLNFQDTFRVWRVLIQPTIRITSAGNAWVHAALTVVSIAAAVAGAMPGPGSPTDERRRYLMDQVFRLVDPSVIARTTPQPMDLRAGVTVRPGDTLALITRNSALSVADITADYGMRILCSVNRRG